MTVGRYATWRKAPTGHWVVWGRHELLVKAHELGFAVGVRRPDGEVQSVYLEHVGGPNWEGWAAGHPQGTFTGEFSAPVQIPMATLRQPKARVRRHGTTNRNQRKRARMR